jgi:hypothetical protein
MAWLQNGEKISFLCPPDHPIWWPETGRVTVKSSEIWNARIPIHIMGCKRPTAAIVEAKSMLSGPSFSMLYTPSLCNTWFVSKFKMAAVIPEVVITSAVYEIEMKFQRLGPCFHGCPFRCCIPGASATFGLSGNSRWRPSNRK